MDTAIEKPHHIPSPEISKLTLSYSQYHLVDLTYNIITKNLPLHAQDTDLHLFEDIFTQIKPSLKNAKLQGFTANSIVNHSY